MAIRKIFEMSKAPHWILFHDRDSEIDQTSALRSRYFPISDAEVEIVEIEQALNCQFGTGYVQSFSHLAHLPWFCSQFVERMLYALSIPVCPSKSGKVAAVSRNIALCLQMRAVKIRARKIEYEYLAGGLSTAIVLSAKFLGLPE
jgi:hypothetical protein